VSQWVSEPESQNDAHHPFHSFNSFNQSPSLQLTNQTPEPRSARGKVECKPCSFLCKRRQYEAKKFSHFYRAFKSSCP
jgi:hypothetical protein